MQTHVGHCMHACAHVHLQAAAVHKVLDGALRQACRQVCATITGLVTMHDDASLRHNMCHLPSGDCLATKTADGRMAVHSLPSGKLLSSWRVPGCSSATASYSSRCSFGHTRDGHYVCVGGLLLHSRRQDFMTDWQVTCLAFFSVYYTGHPFYIYSLSVLVHLQ